MQTPKPISVRPNYPARSAHFLERACFAAATATLGGTAGRNPVNVARSLYPDDEVTHLLLRSAVAGGTTTAPGWAQELATTAVADFLSGLTPQSALAQVIARGITIPIGDRLSVTVPSRTPSAVGGWIAESQPFPIVAAPLSTVVLTPRKCGVGLVLSRELMQLTAAETIFTTMLREASGALLDALALSTDAATPGGLEGLLHGIVPLTTTGSALGDLAQLAEACGGQDGSGQIVFVTSVGVAASLNLRNDIRAGTPIVGSVAVPSTRLVGIDVAGLVFGVHPAPDIEASDEATLVMRDDPGDIGVPGLPPVVGAPTQSMWQTSQIAMKLTFDLSWAKRRGAAVAFVDPIAWV